MFSSEELKLTSKPRHNKRGHPYGNVESVILKPFCFLSFNLGRLSAIKRHRVRGLSWKVIDNKSTKCNQPLVCVLQFSSHSIVISVFGCCHLEFDNRSSLTINAHEMKTMKANQCQNSRAQIKAMRAQKSNICKQKSVSLELFGRLGNKSFLAVVNIWQ